MPMSRYIATTREGMNRFDIDELKRNRAAKQVMDRSKASGRSTVGKLAVLNPPFAASRVCRTIGKCLGGR